MPDRQLIDGQVDQYQAHRPALFQKNETTETIDMQEEKKKTVKQLHIAEFNRDGACELSSQTPKLGFSPTQAASDIYSSQVGKLARPKLKNKEHAHGKM